MNELDKLLKSFQEDPKREEHMKLLADAFFNNLQRDNVEFGGWGIDSKRPFGNSYVEGDIAEIVNIDLSADSESDEYEEICWYLRELYSDLGVYLQYKWKSVK